MLLNLDSELSSHALGALQEFYVERDAQEKLFEDFTDGGESDNLSAKMFSEDWNMSQFWYTDETAEIIARAMLAKLDPDSSIAVICVPSVFIQLKNLIAKGGYGSPRVCLFEFDERFAVLDGYVKYDVNAPLALPPDLQGQFDRFVCDPPFLTADCHSNAAMTAQWLSRSSRAGSPDSLDSQDSQGSEVQVAVCTGERMEGTIYHLYPGTSRTSLEIEHGRNGLSNEYACFANFECDHWKWPSETGN